MQRFGLDFSADQLKDIYFWSGADFAYLSLSSPG